MLFFLAADTCTHRGPIISANSKEAAHCGRFGALGTKNVIQKMARGRHGWVFLSLFIYFARLVAIIGGSYSKNYRKYRFKKFWNCLWRWFTLHGEVETLTLLGHKLIKSMYATLSIIQSPPS